MKPAAVIVLAAGEGTRMKSSTPKVMHAIGGRSLVGHALAAARATDPERVVVVVGSGRELVTAHLAEIDPEAVPVVQEPRNGTGHAVRIALGALPEGPGPDAAGTVLVVCGDVPLLRGETLLELLDKHANEGNAATVLTAIVPDPTGYGRMVRDSSGAVTAIVEHRDATAEQLLIAEINSGIYAFDGALLRSALSRLSTDNSQGEEYLTDTLEILRGDGHRVGAMPAADHNEIHGINDRVQLANLRRLLNERICAHWMRAGVTVIDPASTWIDVDVTLDNDVTIGPNTQLHGRTRIATGAVVGPNTTLTDTEVGEHATVLATHATAAEIGTGVTVGPFSFLRPGTRLAAKSKVGAFCEVKNSNLGLGSKIPHLSYVGDADIGDGTNIGAATIFVNYDGQTKSRTTVGDHAFVGCDTMLIAPVTVNDGAYVAAGSVITSDVPPGAMAVARGTQRNVEGWVTRKRPDSKSAKAAAAAQAAQQPDSQDELDMDDTAP